MSEELHGRHRDTLTKLLGHPASGNVEWREVKGLLESLGAASEERNGALRVTLGGETHVLHRPHKGGLGAAYRAGFAWALERGYERIGQMDCDLSHPPAALAQMHAAVDRGAGLVLGSRYVAGGGTKGWSLARRVISRVGCVTAMRVLGLPYPDLTGGFKLWTADALRLIDVTTTVSNGYIFQVESTRRAHIAGVRIEEVPFVFVERLHGASKMSSGIAAEGALILWRLRRDGWRPPGRRTAPAGAEPGITRP